MSKHKTETSSMKNPSPLKCVRTKDGWTIIGKNGKSGIPTVDSSKSPGVTSNQPTNSCLKTPNSRRQGQSTARKHNLNGITIAVINCCSIKGKAATFGLRVFH